MGNKKTQLGPEKPERTLVLRGWTKPGLKDLSECFQEWPSGGRWGQSGGQLCLRADDDRYQEGGRRVEG